MDESTLRDADALTEPAVALARTWLAQSSREGTRHERATADQLEQIVSDRNAVAFVMRFVDRVVRPESVAVAARQLQAIVATTTLPRFLSPLDRILLRAGARLAPHLPAVVMPLARRRMRAIVGHLVAPAEPDRLGRHLARQQSEGFALNVNLLGEAVLGEGEAERRLHELLALLEEPAVDYVSVKISAIASQLNHFAHDDSLARVEGRLRVLFGRASTVDPPTFVNLDMEEYHDLELTLVAFMTVLDDPDLRHLDAGIVLQAYLPDSYPALQRLTRWANARHDAGGGTIKVRLVKGANLAMERVDAAMHGWEQAPYRTKVDADANYKRCIDWLLTPERLRGVRLGLASHNLFDVAWTRLLSVDRGVADRVQFEMLQGMAGPQARVIAADVVTTATTDATTDTATDTATDATTDTARLLMYTPAVRSENFDVAISYLFRRLEENASEDNFMRHLFGLADDPTAFDAQADIFRLAMERRATVADRPHRRQDRGAPHAAYEIGEPFRNEPDTDPNLAANQRWISEVLAMGPTSVNEPLTTSTAAIDRRIELARSAVGRLPGAERQALLHRVGDELAQRRGELIATMMHEANKTFAEADGEVSEAIDFARFYGDAALDLDRPGSSFEPFGAIAIIPPWNFPVAIAAGGVLASIAAGNAALLKPAPETPRCAELVAEACWAAGVDPDALQFVRTPDDEAGRRLVEGADAVILTGSAETAALFRSWKPGIRLMAETSGKNALVVTPNADLDLAAADLARSAFGHGGQKCSAASVGILVGEAYVSERFRRQLVDAVSSLAPGAATDITTDLAPLVGGLNSRLERALTTLDPGESWLLEPRHVEGDLWTPGIRLGVRPGSWFHRTECFGPVLGLVRADDLDDAIRIQNSSAFGLTGGIHSLDPDEVDQWQQRVEVGNAYVNRPITGAIVQRQPFGGWKLSSVGPGAKAGGPNYVAQLGTWTSDDVSAPDDFEQRWKTHFSVEHDPTGIFCERNAFRYRAIDRVLLRVESGASDRALDLVRAAAATASVDLVESLASDESQADLAARLPSLLPGRPGAVRIRLVGGPAEPALLDAAAELGLHVADQPVTPSGRVELLHYVREQAISTTLHRFGNLTFVS